MTIVQVLETEIHVLTNDKINDQMPKLDRVLDLTLEREFRDEQAVLDQWLQDMFPKVRLYSWKDSGRKMLTSLQQAMDALQSTLRSQIRSREGSTYSSGHKYVQEVKNLLDDDQKTVLWGRAIRKSLLSQYLRWSETHKA